MTADEKSLEYLRRVTVDLHAARHELDEREQREREQIVERRQRLRDRCARVATAFRASRQIAVGIWSASTIPIPIITAPAMCARAAFFTT